MIGEYGAVQGLVTLQDVLQAITGGEWEQWRFEVVDLDDKRIDEMLASFVAAAPDPDDESTG